MLQFPDTVEDNLYELFLGPENGWVNVTSDLLNRDGCDITRGYSSERTTGAATPASCRFSLKNPDGKYSPRNPLGVYYGSFGQNAPTRVSTRTGRDSFDGRTVSSGWGPADIGGNWSIFNGTASNFSVGSGKALHVMTGADTFKVSYLGDYVYRNVEVRATCSSGVANVTGGSLQPINLIVSMLSTSDYFMMSVTISTAEVITVRLNHVDGTEIAASVTLGFANTGQTLAAALQLEGQTLRGKVWDAAGDEPYEWDIEGSTAFDAYVDRAPGWPGVRSGAGTGNTNVPVTYSYDNFEVRINRYHGEVSAWPTKWDVSGNDVYVPVDAGGIRRRLSQGQAALPSPVTRANQTQTFYYGPGSPPHVLYYPVEDTGDSTTIASGLPNIGPMTITGPGKPQLASDSSYVGSGAIGKPNQSRWMSPFISTPATGEIQQIFLLSVPSTGETDLATFTQLTCTGSIGYVDVFYHTGSGGDLEINFYDQGRNLITGTGTLDVNVNGSPMIVSLELTQSGSNVNWTLAYVPKSTGVGISLSSSVSNRTIGAPRRIMASPYTQVASSAIGQIAVRTDIISVFSLDSQLAAYDGEFAQERVARLCQENDGINTSFIRSSILQGTAVGVQGQDTLLDLLDETVKADLGYLYESRDVIGFVHRYGRSLYSQDAALTLDYADGQVQPEFGQTDDNQLILNDFTAKRKGGGSYRATQETGPLALTSPTTGQGAGRYDDGQEYNVHGDDQLPDIATWKVHVGTTDESRFPQVTVNLAKLAKIDWQLYIDALSLDLFDRLEIENPKAVIINGTVSQLVPGYSETMSAKQHEITFVCTPGTPFEVAEAAATTGDTSPWAFRADTDSSYVVPILTGVGVASEGSNAPRTPALPAGIVAGDTLFCLAAIRNSGTGTVDTPTDNTAVPYTLLADGSNFRLFGKIYTGVETAPTVTFTGGVANATCHAQLAAVRGASLNVLSVATQLNGSAQNIAYPGVPVTGGYATILVLGWKQDDWTSVATLAGFSELGEVSTTTGDDAGFVWDYSIQGLTPADIPSGSFTVTGGASAISRGMAVVLAPGAVPVGITALTVATPSGPLWTTNADDFPLYLDVGGLQVRATACAGTGLQTFTIDPLPAARKAGAAGPVSVWHLPVLGQ